MQLSRDLSSLHLIRAWEPGRVRVADRWLTGNVIVGKERIVEAWTSVEPRALTIEHLEPALALELGALAAQALSALGVGPDGGIFELAVDFLEPLSLGVIVKDTSATRRSAL